MSPPELIDYKKWKKLDEKKKISLFDYSYLVINQGDISSDLYFALLEITWPSFTVYKDYVFLKESFSENRAEALIKDKNRVEFWMNLFLTDPYFVDYDDSKKRAEFFALSLVESWTAKLQRDFPDRSFVVKIMRDTDYGDYGLTFYQPQENLKDN